MANKVLNFLAVVGVVLSWVGSAQADFADNFDDGVVTPWVEFDCTYANPQSGAGNGVTESGGWLSTESAAWAMGPQRFTPPYTISVKVNFSGNPGDFEVSIRSSGAAGNDFFGGLPDGIRIQYSHIWGGISVHYSDPGSYVQDIDGAAAMSSLPLNADLLIEDNGDSLIITLTDSSNGSNSTSLTVDTSDDPLLESYSKGGYVGLGQGIWGDGTIIKWDDFAVAGGDFPAAEITETFGSTIVNENDPCYADDTYVISLWSAPSSSVTITADPVGTDCEVNGAGAGNPTTMVFTTADWDTPQTVTVTAIADNTKLEGVETTTVEHAASGDPSYSGISIADVTVTIVDGANAYYPADFVVFGQTGISDFEREKLTFFSSLDQEVATDGTFGPDSSGGHVWVDRQRRLGVRPLVGFSNTCHSSDVDRFENIATNAVSRTAFVSNLIQFCSDYDYDGACFDIEYYNDPSWASYNVLLAELRTAAGPDFVISTDVFGYRGELNSTGLPAVDYINFMAYSGFSSNPDWRSFWLGRGASDDQLLAGMATGWGCCGFDPPLAEQTTQYAIDSAMRGVYLFGNDTTVPATSMLLAVRNTIIDHYVSICDLTSVYDLDGDKKVGMADFAIVAWDWLEPGGTNLGDLIGFIGGWLYELSLITHLEFNSPGGSTAADSSDCSCDGELMNMDGFDWVAGKTGNALDFDGVNDYVELPCFVSLTGSAPRTVAAWIKTDTTGEIVSWGSGSPGEKWILRVQDDNGTAGALRAEVTGGYVVGSTDLRDGAWHHVAAVLEAGDSDILDVKLYVDGQPEVLSASVGPQPINTSAEANMKIGVFTGSNRFFDGLIDDLRIYSRGLSAGEVWLLAN